MDAGGSVWAPGRRITLIGVCLACVMLPLDITILGVAMNSINRELNADFAQLEWVVNAYNLTFGAFLLASGSLADLFGRRRIMWIGLIFFVLMSLLCGLVQDALTLSLLRAAQGIGAALLLSSATAVLGNEFRGTSRAAAFGILSSSFGVGFVLGPLLGGVLTSTVGWRWTFFVNVPVGLAILLLAVPKMRESRDPDAAYVDWAGLFTFTSSLFLLNLALIEGPRAGWIHPLVLWSILGFIAFMGLFVIVEQRQRRAMFNLELFRNPVFVGVLILPIALGFGFVALLIYLPLYFQSVAGYAPWQAGLAMIPLNLPVLIMPPISAQLSLRVPPRNLLALGFILLGLGGLWMHFTIGSLDWKDYVGSLALVGIGAGMVNGIMDNVAISTAPPERIGMATGMFNTMRLVGDALGFAGVGAVLVSVVRISLSQLMNSRFDTSGMSLIELANQVARGDISRAAASLPPAVQITFLDAAEKSYADGLRVVFVSTAVICFTAATVMYQLLKKEKYRKRL